MADADGERSAAGPSVRTRILVSILVVAVLGLTVAGASAYLIQRDRILHDVDDRLLLRVEAARAVVTGVVPAEQLGAALPAASGTGPITTTRGAVEAVLARVVPGADESSLGLVDGVPAFIPGVPIDFHLEQSPGFVARVVREVADGDVVLGTATGSLGHVRYVASPVLIEGDAAQGVYVTAIDIDATLSDLDAAFASYAAIAVGAVVAIGLVGWFVAGRLLRPLRRLRDTASRITVSDLAERIPVRGTDDVSELGRTVNGMLDRLEDSIEGQRRLLDDVRHELKTPITVVRGHLELLDPGDPDDVTAIRDLSLGELDRMALLVDDIELLAEAEHDTVRLEPFDVEQLTAEVFAKASGLPGHAWRLAGTTSAVLELDPTRITQAWLQLVDNAAKYSPDGSPIRIGSIRRDDTVELWVEDEGDGVPPGAEQRIFERFGRAHEGRGVSGSGLGLPIVAAIAHAHGGRVSLATSSAGSRFAIVLPLPAPGDPAVAERAASPAIGAVAS